MMTFGPHSGSRACKVAVLVANGVVGGDAVVIHSALFAGGAVPRFIAPHLGAVRTTDDNALEADASPQCQPGVLFDALVCPHGLEAVDTLSKDWHTLAFVRDHYRHGKPLLLLGASCALLKRAGIASELPDGSADPGIVFAEGARMETIEAFIQAISRHRYLRQKTEPLRV